MNNQYVRKIRKIYTENPELVYDNTLNTFVRGIELSKLIYSEEDLKKLKNDILKTIESIRWYQYW